MDFLHGNIKQIYFGYLAAAFGSTRISSVYSIVNMAMMGQAVSGAGWYSYSYYGRALGEKA